MCTSNEKCACVVGWGLTIPLRVFQPSTHPCLWRLGNHSSSSSLSLDFSYTTPNLVFYENQRPQKCGRKREVSAFGAEIIRSYHHQWGASPMHPQSSIWWNLGINLGRRELGLLWGQWGRGWTGNASLQLHLESLEGRNWTVWPGAAPNSPPHFSPSAPSLHWMRPWPTRTSSFPTFWRQWRWT